MDKSTTNAIAKVAFSILYTATLVPIFIFGGVMLWGGELTLLIGLLLMLHSIVSFLILVTVWTKPTASIMRIEKISDIVIFILLLGAVAQDRFDTEAKKYLLGGILLIFGLKWISIKQLYRYRTSSAVEFHDEIDQSKSI